MSNLLLYALIGGSTAVSAYGQYQTGKAQQEALERQAEEEKLRAKTEELARREELNRTLAANQVAMATSGISGMTPESIALESARKVSESESVIALSESLKQRQLKRQGEAARYAGTIGAASTILSGAESAARVE
jgi:hypothetical protein